MYYHDNEAKFKSHNPSNKIRMNPTFNGSITNNMNRSTYYFLNQLYTTNMKLSGC